MATGKRKRVGVGYALFRALLTLLLIGVLCACFCGIAFAYYVHAYINPVARETAQNISRGLGLNLNTFIYANDPATGQETLYQTLSGLESREWVDSEEIPQDLKNAAVAIEDQRFYKHSGVDWWRTMGAVKGWLFGGKQYGGSTITQQLIKNITRDNDYSVKRKVNEIFRAFALEDEVGDKDRILTMYLNTIYLGYRCYGVETAAQTYFGKDVSQLDLAECAVLAGLTNNPSDYDPYNRPERVKERQEAILHEMCTQGMISEAERDAAIAEQLNYRPYEEYIKDVGEPYTYFTDAVVNDVVEDLVEQKGYSEQVASNMVNSGGLRIYATIDLEVQQILDAVWADDSNFPNTEKYGERPQSAMVITDKLGNIVGIAGGRGTKSGKLDFSFATDARRQPGSSIKPLAVYGPAMDKGVIVPTSTVYDKALRKDSNGRPWPMNDGRMPSGNALSVKSGITSSVNTIAVQVLNALTPQYSYDFMTQRLGFQDSLVGSRTNADGTVQSDIDLAPLALGGLTDGVTVREMAGGFSAFINDGVFAGTRTYTKVLDSEGNIVLENNPGTELGFRNVRTAYFMLDCMQAVTSYGTASGTTISGVQTAGKTGTTTANTDIWFCGVTPQYSAAVWVGYEHNYRLDGLYGRNAANIWRTVMARVHEGDSGLVFDSHPQDFETASYCMDSGLAPSGACRSAGRVATGRFWKGQVPTELCQHQNIPRYDLGRTTGIEVEKEEEEEKPEETTTNPAVDPETGLPVTPATPTTPNTPTTPTTPTDPGTTTPPATTDPGTTTPTDPGTAVPPTDPGTTTPPTTDPGTTAPTDPGTAPPPSDDPEA